MDEINKMLEGYEPKGELIGIPKEIIAKMLEEQYKAGNILDLNVFEFRSTRDSKNGGGFSWDKSSDGYQFWYRILSNRDFNSFFEKYSKKLPKPYPKVMWVWDSPRDKNKRVVFMEKNGKYLAWNGAETLEDSEEITETITWDNAEEISDLPDYTKKDLVEKLGHDFNFIK